MNVDPAEGDLAALDGEQLAARLEGVKYQYEQAAAFQSAAGELAGYNLGEAILYGLVLLLIGEQILAWSASYHPARRDEPLGCKEAPHDARLLAAVGRGRHPHHVRMGTHPVERRLDSADRRLASHSAVRPLPVSPRRGGAAGRSWGWLLTALRTATFLGLLILFLQPHWRSEREEVRNSRVLLLVDTSLSMGLTDADDASASSREHSRVPPPVVSRTQQVAAALKETDFLARLRKTHDVAVFQFSEDLKRDRVVTLGKLPPDETRRSCRERAGERRERRRPCPRRRTPPPDWAKLLAPTGTETRLGQALRQLIQDERGTPVSGIIVFSDGGQNAGISPEAAVELAQEAKIPVFTVGLGSDRQPTNVAVCDLAVPARAYPGDHYTVTGYLQAQGHGGQGRSRCKCSSRPAGERRHDGAERGDRRAWSRAGRSPSAATAKCCR